MSTNNDHTTLYGDEIEIWAVEDPDDEELRADTYIGATTDEIEIERDPEIAEHKEHANPFEQRHELQESAEATLTFLLTTTMENLLAANVYRENADLGIYEPAKNYRNDAIEFDVKDPADPETTQQTYRAYEAQPVVESVAMDVEGPVTLECNILFQSNHGWVADIATTDQMES